MKTKTGRKGTHNISSDWKIRSCTAPGLAGLEGSRRNPVRPLSRLSLNSTVVMLHPSKTCAA